MRTDSNLDVQLACIWEATARKPGNVHRYCDFADVTYLDFILSAAAIAPVLADADAARVGSTIHECVRRTRLVARSNTNLGIILLLAPLAAVRDVSAYRQSLDRDVVARLSVEDSREVAAAIRLAAPGGLGEVAEHDVRDQPTLPLRAWMALAADRDLIARQYANGYAEIFEDVAPEVLRGLERCGSIEGGIIWAALHVMSRYPDSLIARKRGSTEANESAARARGVLEHGWPHTPAATAAFAEFDAWLRERGHSRNPGTTADCIAAALFVLLRQERIPRTLPFALADRGGAE